MKRPLSRLFMGDYGAVASKKLITIFAGLLSATLVARLLGPELRGGYAVILNSVAILVLIFNFGVSNYFQSSRRSLGDVVVPKFVVFAILLFFTICITIYLVSGYLSLNLLLILWLSAFSVLRLNLLSFCLIQNIRGSSIAAVAGSIIEIVFLLSLFIFQSHSLSQVAISLIAKDALISILCLIYLVNSVDFDGRSFKHLGFFAKGFKDVIDLKNWDFSRIVVMFLLTFFIGVNYKIDVIILKYYSIGDYVVGLFSVGVLISEYLWIFSDVFKEVQASRSAKGGEASDAAASNRYAIFSVFLVSVLFVIFGFYLIILLFGESYGPSYEFALFALIYNIFMIPCKVLGSYLISLGAVRYYLTVMVAAAGFNILLGLIFVPVFGVYGAVIANFFSYVFAGVSILIYFSRTQNLPLFSLIFVRKSEILILFQFLKSKMLKLINF